MERNNNYYLVFIREISPADLLPGARVAAGGNPSGGFEVCAGPREKECTGCGPAPWDCRIA